MVVLLPGPGLADQGYSLTRLHGEADTVQGLPAGLVGKDNVG